MGTSHHTGKFKQRFEQARRFVAPLLQQTGRPLNKMRALEVGCGEGPKTCALAPMFKEYVGIDLDADGLAMGVANVEALNITNADLRLQEAEDLPDILANEQFDVIFLYAVLEHLTISERLETLRLCWEALPPDGLLYIGETPNRIAPIDYHSSRLPYLNLLPPELAQHFIDRSSHESWRNRVRSEETIELGLYRNGQHVGFEEFDLSIAPPEELGAHLIADNWSEPMMNLHPLRWFEPRNLNDFEVLCQSGFHTQPLPSMFARYWIEGILAKTAPKNPLPTIRFLTLTMVRAKDKQAKRIVPDRLGVPIQRLRNGEAIDCHIDAQATEVMLGISEGSQGKMKLILDGAPFGTFTMDEIRAANEGLWTLQSWKRIPLPTSAKTKFLRKPTGPKPKILRIIADCKDWIGICPPFVR
jgi:ubiquinone/menaquinone biosynthesis C-methylase UbiE